MKPNVAKGRYGITQNVLALFSSQNAVGYSVGLDLKTSSQTGWSFVGVQTQKFDSSSGSGMDLRFNSTTSTVEVVIEGSWTTVSTS